MRKGSDKTGGLTFHHPSITASMLLGYYARGVIKGGDGLHIMAHAAGMVGEPAGPGSLASASHCVPANPCARTGQHHAHYLKIYRVPRTDHPHTAFCGSPEQRAANPNPNPKELTLTRTLLQNKIAEAAAPSDAELVADAQKESDEEQKERAEDDAADKSENDADDKDEASNDDD